MWIGFVSGVAGCALWGFIYLIPLLLPDYDPVSLAMGRFTVFGTGSLFLWFKYREQLLRLRFDDWLEAFKLGFIGNAVYYVFLSQGIQLSGAPLAGMLMALIPVLVALITNRPSDENNLVIPWCKLWIPLAMIIVGLLTANITEFELVTADGSSGQFWFGAVSSTIAVLIWTWFPIKNARWQQNHPEISPFAWTTAQGIIMLPMTIILLMVINAENVFAGINFFGPSPRDYILLMFAAGIVCGWGGMALWNNMSARLPIALSGQMIVFETIFSVIYAHVYRGEWPSVTMIVGMTLLLAGVLLSLKFFRNEQHRRIVNHEF